MDYTSIYEIHQWKRIVAVADGSSSKSQKKSTDFNHKISTRLTQDYFRVKSKDYHRKLRQDLLDHYGFIFRVKGKNQFIATTRLTQDLHRLF